ncbi:unnamed protein product [Rotaria magnacalcarata]|uniref:Uncharacterized protein n=1 Tax=Rotaria magnacalcarata TaxID=392030 RepID=A0A819MXQ7_9BILA|nr:unnamed protein product [Rotaria magnacalcarata]CAF3987936.1 unnamed protein product [Rotaria magnacalcarata]
MDECYESVPPFALIERFGFAIAPTFLIVITNMTLLVRVVWQKYRFHRIVEWKKQRKLTIHIVTISFLYLFFDFPFSVIYLVRLFGNPYWGHDALPILFYYAYSTIFLLPIVCIGSLPELWNKVKMLDP